MSEKDVDFKLALEIAKAMETADKDADDMQGVAAPADKPAEVNQAKSTVKPQIKEGRSPCYHCGGRHLARDCKFKDSDCHACGKKGHIARACRSKKKATQNKGSRADTATHNVED